MRFLIAAAMPACAVLLAWPAAAAPASCAGLGGTLEAGQTGQLCHVRASSPTYTLNLVFPVDYPDEQTLTDYIAQNRDGFVSVAQGGAPGAVPGSGGRDQPYQMEATTEQHSSGSPVRTRSVVLKLFQDLGGAHPSNWYKAFNFNLNARQPITFDNLFAPGSTPLDSIFPIVQRDLERQTALGTAISPSTGLASSHYQNFAITDDQLIFYFAQGEMLPAVAGPVQAQVPRNAIPPLAI
jgi:hypothetical protein